MGIEVTGNVSRSGFGAPDARTTPQPVEVMAPKAVEHVTQAVQNFESAQNQNDQQGEQRGNKPSESTIKQAISDINKKINPNTIAQYGYHDDTNRVTIKIVNKDTDDVIKEYPAEETLDMIAKVWELAGMFVDEKG